MPISPVDIHNKEFRRSLRGYKVVEVDEFLDEIVQEMDRLLQENEMFEEELKELNARIEQYRNMEDTLQQTLVVAQETAEEVRSNARKEAQVVVAEAKAESKRIKAQAHKEVEHLREQSEQVRQQMLEYLGRAKANAMIQLDVIKTAQRDLNQPTQNDRQEEAST